MTVVMALLVALCGWTTDPASVAPSAGAAPPQQGAAQAGVSAPQPRGASGRPNIVVIQADDMRYDDLRFAPNVRRLFRRGGVEFQNSFSNYPLCCPARASFLTGQHAHQHKVYSHKAPYGYGAFDDSRTIATTLRRSGYKTGFVGKYLNGYGMQRSRVSGGPSYTYVPRGWTRWYGAQQRPRGSKRPRGGTYFYRRTTYNVDGRASGRRYWGEYQSNTLGRFSRQLVQRFSGGRQPFFLYLSFVAPHHGGPREKDDPRPHRTGGRTFEFKTPAVPGWVRGRFDRRVPRAPGVPADGSDPQRDVSDIPVFLRLPELIRKDRVALREVARQRAESIYVLDQQVGKLVTKLRRTGELSRTVLMFTSDNGFFLGEHRVRTGKIRAHEPSLRVPFLIRGPGIPRGKVRYAPVSTVDQSATILRLGGAAGRHPLPLDGRSILPDLTRDRAWTEPVLTEALLRSKALHGPEDVVDDTKLGRLQVSVDGRFDDARDAVGVRTARWSYIRYRNGSGELYDLHEDPDQLVNLFNDPGSEATQGQLDVALNRVRDCRGTGCRSRLPPELVTRPAGNRRLTSQWFRQVRR